MERSLAEIQQSVDDWVIKNGGYWPPLGMLAAITEEVGEISREILDFASIKPKKSGEVTKSLASELGDLFFALICMANSYNISLDSAIALSIKKYKTRDANRFTQKKENEI